MTCQEELQRAIGVHLLWKARLKAAVTSGLSLPTAESLRRDDLCEFGKWLRSGAPKLEPCSDLHQRVDRLHAAFHQAAAEVVDQDRRGDAGGAASLVAPGGAFQEASEQLLAAMTVWHERLGLSRRP